MEKDIKSLKFYLEKIFKKYNKRELLFSDPVKFAHRYKRKEDIEVSAFIASVFSFGRVDLIFKVLDKIFSFLGENPYYKIKEIKEKEIEKEFKNFYYRFFRRNDLYSLFFSIKKAIKEEGSIENLFMKFYKNLSFIRSLCSLADFFENKGRFPLVSNPEKGGTAKRILLFLRWMVRKDEVDFGIWNGIKKSELLIPLDTHIFKVSKSLGLTTYKNPCFKSVVEITDNLKKICPYDPVKYDFALTRIGILKNLKIGKYEMNRTKNS